ncbi:tyrosine-type recombinase/integrase [Egicoccus sp. AB-alg2]|uniref:tyrosine-type recombinase/integrase n=1 Tax=Egicoccus sp. AB-alg2 TaxID=3242693 RepID=UPI00359F05FA
MATNRRRQRARRGSGSITPRGQRFFARVDLGLDADGKRIRRNRSFDTRREAQAWIDQQRSHSEELILPVADQRLDEYLRWWLEHEAPKGKPGRAPLAATTLQGYRINIERHLIPALGQKRVGQLTVSDLDAFANRKLAEGYTPSTVNRIRETLRSALSTAVRQDRLIRNVARYGGGVGAAPPPVDRFSDAELGAILAAARDEHYYPIILLLARTGLRIGEACGLRWRDMALRTAPPRLTVVWQLDKWGQIVDPKSPTSRRTIPLREEVVSEVVRWRDLQEVWADRLGEHFVNEHGLVFTTKTGRPISKRNIARSFERACKAAGVEHGTLKTLRSTVATQLAEGGLHPRKAQTFLGHAHMSTTMKYYTAVSDVDDAAALLPDLP